MQKSEIIEVVSEIRKESKKRNFTQAVDIAVSLKDINLKDPSKRFRSDVIVPHKVQDDIKVCVIGDDDTVNAAKEAGVRFTLNQAEITEFAKNANEAKAFIADIDYFVAVPRMMASVGKTLGRYLGPAGKMPTVMPPNAPIDTFVGRYFKTVRIRVRQNPVINCKIGNEKMTDEEISDNIVTLLHEIEKNLDNGFNQVKSAYVKFTMSAAKQLKV